MENRVTSSTTSQSVVPFYALRRCIAACVFMLAWTGSSWGGSVTYSYDALGRIIQATYSTGVVITYVYDAAGNRTSYVVTGAPS